MNATLLKILPALLIAFAGCDSDLQLDTKAVDMKCEDNPLHPDCQEQLSASEVGDPAAESLPPLLSSFALANEGTDGYINKTEKLSSLPAFTYKPIPQVVASYSSWVTQSVACDETTVYEQTELPPISLLPDTDGPYYVCVELNDQKRQRKAYGRTPMVELDATLPVIGKVQPLTLGAQGTIDTIATDANLAEVLWSKKSGPGSVTFGTPAVAKTTVSADAVGAYELQLSAKDNCSGGDHRFCGCRGGLRTPVIG